MRRTLLLFAALLAPGCSCSDEVATSADAAPETDAPDEEYSACAGTSQAFVREATVALLGRHPRGQAEVQVYADLYDQVAALDPPPLDPREAVARALMQDPEFLPRWRAHFMDALRVHRIEYQSQSTCYGAADRTSVGPELADLVRSMPAMDNGDGRVFTMRDLLDSALVLDDVSPVYRAHLFAMISRPLEAANVPAIQAELARRSNFGGIFDDAYLNRDLVCLTCHNSETSVTYRPDPAENRHWPMPGLFERSLYGESMGIDPDRAHAVFRYDEFVVDPFFGGGGARPWGWDGECGRFRGTPGLDPAHVDGRFGALTGEQLSVYDLEASLRRGFDSLAAGGLALDGEGVPDPDQAFAWLVSASIVEGVFEQVVGSPLTIANYFPRNQAQRDVLVDLTTTFVASRYSLKALLLAILESGYFNRLPPEAGCGEAYAMPNVYNPWVIGEDEPAMRRNSPADGVFPLSARTLIHAADQALEWPTRDWQDFPEDDFCGFLEDCGDLEEACSFHACCAEYQAICVNGEPPTLSPGAVELLFLRGLGAFLTNTERGFRGLEFQARLVWEKRYGACATPPGAGSDYVADLVTRAAADGAPLREVVVALKDRMAHRATIEDDERAPLEALLGASLDDAAAPGHEPALRRLCGVLVASPQFVLGGLAAPDGDAIPSLTPDDAAYDAVCATLAARPVAGVTVTCSPGSLTVAPAL